MRRLCSKHSNNVVRHDKTPVKSTLLSHDKNILSCDMSFIMWLLCLSQFQLGTSPLGNLWGFAQKIAQGVGIWLLKAAWGPGIWQGSGFCGKFKLWCVLKRRFVFPVLNNFSETPCIKVGLDVRIPLIRVLSTGGWREASPQTSHLPPPPPKKRKFFLKKNLNAISKVDLIWRRY